MKLLIVDDEPIILRGLVKVIRDAASPGSDVRSAGNAYEAIELMKTYRPDVTVTDLHMPERSGFELMKEAKEVGLCERFIVLTGHDDFEYVRQALRYGVVDYLLKPIDKDEISALLGKIEDLLPSDADQEGKQHAKRILSYTKANYMNDLSLDHLADLMELHPSYISSLFKKETGDTFVNYLNAFRIKEAQSLLRTHRHLSVNEIGRRVGIENKHYFNKVFKKYAGVTPGAYREQKADERCGG